MLEVGTGKASELKHYVSPKDVVEDLQPDYPVYCVRPHAIRPPARTFVEQFPGHTLYAVKSNPMPHMLQELHDAGINHFDTASIAEIQLVSRLLPDAHCYFMHPVKARTAIRDAHQEYGVRHYVIDHEEELQKIGEIIPASREIIIVVRLALHHSASMYDLSTKFGTSVDGAIQLLAAIEARGFSAGLCFHVGSQCTDADAYRVGIDLVREVMRRTSVSLRCIDVGGGFPGHYLSQPVAGLNEYIASIKKTTEDLEIPEGCEILCEPGRGLAADGESLIVQVQLRKDDALYINDGLYGSMNEEMQGLQRLHRMVPTREFASSRQPFILNGPTCDSEDALPKPFLLPGDIDEGDWIEFGGVGAYGAACRTAFNGFYADTFVTVEDDFEADPASS
ncbi:MAG: type III PLP-dependent enzyme [Myxococcota bacterium]|nr:type III PLP-dependent enzyme [Myxococcota bacterium]